MNNEKPTNCELLELVIFTKNLTQEPNLKIYIHNKTNAKIANYSTITRLPEIIERFILDNQCSTQSKYNEQMSTEFQTPNIQDDCEDRFKLLIQVAANETVSFNILQKSNRVILENLFDFERQLPTILISKEFLDKQFKFNDTQYQEAQHKLMDNYEVSQTKNPNLCFGAEHSTKSPKLIDNSILEIKTKGLSKACQRIKKSKSVCFKTALSSSVGTTITGNHNQETCSNFAGLINDLTNTIVTGERINSMRSSANSYRDKVTQNIQNICDLEDGTTNINCLGENTVNEEKQGEDLQKIVKQAHSSDLLWGIDNVFHIKSFMKFLIMANVVYFKGGNYIKRKVAENLMINKHLIRERLSKQGTNPNENVNKNQKDNDWNEFMNYYEKNKMNVAGMDTIEENVNEEDECSISSKSNESDEDANDNKMSKNFMENPPRRSQQTRKSIMIVIKSENSTDEDNKGETLNLEQHDSNLNFRLPKKNSFLFSADNIKNSLKSVQRLFKMGPEFVLPSHCKKIPVKAFNSQIPAQARTKIDELGELDLQSLSQNSEYHCLPRKVPFCDLAGKCYYWGQCELEQVNKDTYKEGKTYTIKGVGKYLDDVTKSYYEGQFEDGFKVGYGREILKNGDVYEGGWDWDHFNGFGKYSWSDGSFYQGDWHASEKNGKGIYSIFNKSRYEGDFRNDMFEGNGMLMWQNGNKYIGKFRLGVKDGRGTFLWYDNSYYRGHYKSGKYSGKGELVMSDGTKYVGNFTNGKYQGIGILEKSDGNVYLGDFDNGVMHGIGILKWKNGTKYKGNYQNGLMEGKGQLIWPTGDKYTGDFEANKMHGFGVLEKTNGTKLEGRFDFGKYNKDYVLPVQEKALSIVEMFESNISYISPLLENLNESDIKKTVRARQSQFGSINIMLRHSNLEDSNAKEDLTRNSYQTNIKTVEGSNADQTKKLTPLDEPLFTKSSLDSNKKSKPIKIKKHSLFCDNNSKKSSTISTTTKYKNELSKFGFLENMEKKSSKQNVQDTVNPSISNKSKNKTTNNPKTRHCSIAVDMRNYQSYQSTNPERNPKLSTSTNHSKFVESIEINDGNDHIKNDSEIILNPQSVITSANVILKDNKDQAVILENQMPQMNMDRRQTIKNRASIAIIKMGNSVRNDQIVESIETANEVHNNPLQFSIPVPDIANVHFVSEPIDLLEDQPNMETRNNNDEGINTSLSDQDAKKYMISNLF